MKSGYPIHVKLLTEKRRAKFDLMQEIGVNFSQLVRNLLDEYKLPKDKKKEVAA